VWKKRDDGRTKGDAEGKEKREERRNIEVESGRKREREGEGGRKKREDSRSSFEDM